MLAVALLSVPVAGAGAVEISTGDGLRLGLADRTGKLESVRVGQVDVRLRAPAFPLRIRELDPARVLENLVPNPSFEEGLGTPRAWRSGPGAARTEQFSHTGRFCGKVSAPAKATPAARASSPRLPCDPIPARPGRLYRMTAWGRVPSGASGGTVFALELDAQGKALVANKFQVQHAAAWRADVPDQWLRREVEFITKPECARLQIYVNIWKGYGDFYVDDLELVDCDGRWAELRLTPRPVEAEPSGAGWLERIDAPNARLELRLRYVSRPDHIRIHTTVEDRSNPPRERSLAIDYTLPIDLAGWTWHDDGRNARRIEPGTVYENAFSMVGARVSRYPFTSVTRAGTGLALAAPMDAPRIQNFLADAARGYSTAVDLGLAPQTAKIGAGRADFVTVLYRHDDAWGMRAAAERYYRIFPEFFARRATRDGTWFYVVDVSRIPHPEDFGPAFYEGFPRNAKQRDFLRAHAIAVLPYTEPWGARQVFPEAETVDQLPTLAERLELLRSWAADCRSSARLLGGPRWEVAQAVLNSLPDNAEGEPAGWKVDKYSHWAQWWMTNTNPGLARPNRATTCLQFEIEPVLAQADGIYLDSVSPWLADYLNFRREHFAAAEYPLVVDRRTGRPALLGMLSCTEFMDWLADDLRRRGKLLQMNIFPTAYRFCAHRADVLGSEVGHSGRNRPALAFSTDADALLRRMLAYHKPTSNLLQEGNYRTPAPELTHDEVVGYLHEQLFYGFYPGIATIGGEERAGYAGWKRYFGTPAQYERDRAAFKATIAALGRLSVAGWEPVPYARTSPETILLERFGHWQKKDLHYTLRNPTGQPERVSVRLEAAPLGISSSVRPGAREVLGQTAIPLTADAAAGALEFSLELPARRTAVVWIEPVGSD